MSKYVNHKSRQSGGFTLIELLLAMTFITILLLVIAATVIQIANIYNKGITLKSVDVAGRALSADIRQTISASQPFTREEALKFEGDVSNPVGGRLCTGTYSYIWNYGNWVNSTDTNVKINRYDTPTSTDTPIRFVKVRDNGGQYCVDTVSKISKADDPVELLAGGDEDLAIQSFDLQRLDTGSTDQGLYSINLVVGTNNQEAIDTVDARCLPPSSDSGLQDFCAINRFEFTATAGNKGGE